MRKLVLIAAMVLVSATAQAGASRGLTMASNDEVPAAEQPKAVAAPADAPVDTPKYIARPAPVDSATPAPKGDEGKPVADRDLRAPKAARSRHHHGSIEARVIYELHRHGIYW
jgi:hypothetical protein